MKEHNNNSIWQKWEADRYLDDYFRDLGEDAELTLQFIVRELTALQKPVSRLLEFGSGPTIIGVAGATAVAQEIHVADYLQNNLGEIRAWLNNDDCAFSHEHIIGHILTLEGISPTKENILIRENELRKKIRAVLFCDAGLVKPVPGQNIQYPLIISLYCADSATSSKQTWSKYMKNILSLLEASGTILLAALHQCRYYTVGNQKFPSANISVTDIEMVLAENGFSSKNISIELVKSGSRKKNGFNGLCFIRAIKDPA